MSIDNAVELAIRTYLGLPKRVRGCPGPPRKDLQAVNTYPDLMDLFEKFGGDKLQGIDLGDIEWYHRIRNTLYHDGTGVTVDPERVDAYNQIANLLFKNLFEAEVVPESEHPPETLLGKFVLKWATLEIQIRSLASNYLPIRAASTHSLISLYDGLIANAIVSQILRQDLLELLTIRNKIIHNTNELNSKELLRLIVIIDKILDSFPKYKNMTG